MKLPESIQKIYNHLKSEKGISQIALLPIFFSWYPIILFHFEHPIIRRYCFSSLIHTGLFFLFLALGGIVSKLPSLGSLIANILHMIGIAMYLVGSGILIYSVQKEKNMVLLYERKILEFLNSYLVED